LLSLNRLVKGSSPFGVIKKTDLADPGLFFYGHWRIELEFCGEKSPKWNGYFFFNSLGFLRRIGREI
jgi:hypothetical protein